MNQPNHYPTRSDISMFMRTLGYQWSNDAQIYYNENVLGYTHMTDEAAERLYKSLHGDSPFLPAPTQDEGGEIRKGV